MAAESSTIEVPYGAEILTFGSWEDACAFFTKPEGADRPEGTSVPSAGELTAAMEDAITAAGPVPALAQPDPAAWLAGKAVA